MTTLRARAILFDMDGTLLDSNEASEITWQAWAKEKHVPIESIRAVHHGRRPEETIALVAPGLDALAESKGIYASQLELEVGVKPIPGARAFYDSVPGRARAIVTAANQAILEHRFRLVGLSVPPVCVTATMLKKGKPDPEGYLLGAELLGQAPADCVVFEDAPAGLLAAKRAGIRSVAVLTNYTEAQLREELGADYEAVLAIPDYQALAIEGSAFAAEGSFLIRA
jgi:mannitol-1-/sugar-/sorbitol-6-phosphatase